MKFKDRVQKLEKTIVEKGKGKVFVLRSLKDLIVYYDTYIQRDDGTIPEGEPPEIDNQLPYELRKFINEYYEKNPEAEDDTKTFSIIDCANPETETDNVPDDETNTHMAEEPVEDNDTALENNEGLEESAIPEFNRGKRFLEAAGSFD